MEQQEQKNENELRQSYGRGRVFAGLFLLLVGGVYLLRQAGVVIFPYWLFSWPMILILLGLFVGIKHSFRGPGWAILMIIGAFFLLDFVNYGIDLRRYMWPAIIIVVGLLLIIKPKKKWSDKDCSRYGRHHWRHQRERYYHQQPPVAPVTEPGQQTSGNATSSPDDYIDSVSVLGGVDRVIMSKTFKGGEVTSFLGGTQVDLSQADIQGTVVLEMVQVMGGAKLIVPASWYIKNEITAFLGGLEDKRQIQPSMTDPNKVLILKGASVMGGLEIRNF